MVRRGLLQGPSDGGARSRVSPKQRKLVIHLIVSPAKQVPLEEDCEEKSCFSENLLGCYWSPLSEVFLRGFVNSSHNRTDQLWSV